MKKRNSEGGETLHLKRQLKTLRAKFEEEKRCKNTAYYFILSMGLLDHFRAFNRAYDKTIDPFQDARNAVINEGLKILSLQHQAENS